MSQAPESVTVGESRTLRSTWRDEDGNLVAATVTLDILTPSGDIETPVLTNPSTGVYEYELVFDESGDWRWEWTGSTDLGTKKCRGAACAYPSHIMAATSPGS